LASNWYPVRYSWLSKVWNCWGMELKIYGLDQGQHMLITNTLSCLLWVNGFNVVYQQFRAMYDNGCQIKTHLLIYIYTALHICQELKGFM